MPKLRFLFTRTSLPCDTSDEQTLPLQNRKNVEFEQTSANQRPFAPLQFLPPRTRELIKVLGYDCAAILNRLRLKEFADKVINDIEDIDAEERRSRERTYRDGEMQTESYKCSTCITRESRANKSMQTDAPKKVSIRTQTNEKDYRDPLIRSLARLTAGQLVAVSDFVNLICEQRPTTSQEVFCVREKLMDIYNLSERGSDAIEAERSREHESRRRGINNSPPLEDLRATIRGTSDHNMGGRIPPPPPLLINYHLDVGMIDAEQQQRDNRQLRYEENLRMEESLRLRRIEEQRIREWEMQQQFLQQQQLQLQLQREQEEENARLEMRNDRRNGFGRGNQWNGGRNGLGRY